MMPTKDNTKVEEANTIVHSRGDGDICYASTLEDVFLIATDTLFSQNWIIDSGTSFHVTPHREWFVSYDASRKGCVRLGNDYACDIVGVGDVHLKFTNGSFVCAQECATCATAH